MIDLKKNDNGVVVVDDCVIRYSKNNFTISIKRTRESKNKFNSFVDTWNYQFVERYQCGVIDGYLYLKDKRGDGEYSEKVTEIINNIIEKW